MRKHVSGSRIDNMILLAVLAVYFSAICLINFSAAPSMYDADMYCDYWYALQVWEHKSIFPDGWVFGNQLNAVSTPVLAGILYGLFRNWNVSLAAACTVMAVLTVVCYCWMMCGVNRQRKSRLLAVAVFLAITLYFGKAISGNKGWTLFFTMCSYYAGYSITAFLAFGCYLRSLKGLAKKEWILLGVTCVLSFGTGIQSIRQTIVMVLPLLAAEFFRLLFGYKKWALNRHPLLVAGGISAANVMGLIAVRLMDISQITILGEIEVTPVSGVADACKTCFKMIHALLSNGKSESNAVLAVLLLICAVSLTQHVLLKEKKEQWLNENMLLLLFAVSIVCIAGIDIVTTMAIQPRYYFMIYPMIGYLVAYLYERCSRSRVAVMLVLLLIFGISCVRELPSVCKQAWNRKSEESYAVGEYLLKNGYDTVYSNWDHGEDYAFATAGEIKVGYWEDTIPFVPVMYICDLEIYEAEPEHCVYIFRGSEANEIGKEKALQKSVELQLLRYLPDSETYIYTASRNLMGMFR